jgi:hypothetical protein
MPSNARGRDDWWDDVPEYEARRILALPLAERVYAMLDHAGKASAVEIVAALGNEHTVSEVRAIRNAWKAAGRAMRDEGPPQLPVRDELVSKLTDAARLNRAAEVEKWIRSIAALDRMGSVDASAQASEDWDRLTDAEAGALIALTRKLNGASLTRGDEACLTRLR